MEESKIRKIGTLGGSLEVNKTNSWIYLGDNKGRFSKEKLFGIRGPLHPGMPYEHELALSALHSDTRQTLIRELVNQTSLTREEAERVVNDLLKKGILEEVDDPNLGKVLVLRGRNEEDKF